MMDALTEESKAISNFTVILVQPQNPENIGLVARNMKNTGFKNLRVVKLESLEQKSYKTAVHARDILEKTRLYSSLSDAIGDLELVFAATSKKRKNFPLLSLKNAVAKMFEFPPTTKIGLLFGNERTGLTSDELLRSNFRFTIPQAARQPSYNLASAVLLSLFHIYTYRSLEEIVIDRERPISRKEQEECLQLILDKLKKKKFLHRTNRQHMTEMIYDLFGKLAMTSKDRKLLLALFAKGID
jgi:tRNA/rRNA methyltransferase